MSVDRRAAVAKDRGRTVRPWRVRLYGLDGHLRRTRWFRRHDRALRWAIKRVTR